MKTCSQCGVEKSLDEFYSHAQTKDGKNSHCNKCQNKMTRSWEQKNPEKYKKTYTKVNKKSREKMRHKYPREELLNMFNNQCQQCGNSNDLLVHHKDNNGHGNKNPNNNLSNLEVLCKSCHTKQHWNGRRTHG